MLKNVEGRNFMKKMLAIVLAVVCVLSFTACTNNNVATDKNEHSNTDLSNYLRIEDSARVFLSIVKNSAWHDTHSYRTHNITYEIPSDCEKTQSDDGNSTYFYTDFGMIMVQFLEDTNFDFCDDSFIDGYISGLEDSGAKVTYYKTVNMQNSTVFEADWTLAETDTNYCCTSLLINSGEDTITFTVSTDSRPTTDEQYSMLKSRISILEDYEIPTTEATNQTKKTTTTTKKTTTTAKPTTTTTTTKQTIYNPSKNPNWSWQGSGDYVATGLEVTDYAVLNISHNGSSNFYVRVISDNNTDGLVNEIGSYNGQVLIDESGTYEVEIHADGNWNITASGLSVTDSTNFSGTGDSVTPIFNTTNQNWAITHTGESNFYVREYEVGYYGDGLVNEIGNYSGVVHSDVSGNCFFKINADGNWTIKPAS